MRNLKQGIEQLTTGRRTRKAGPSDANLQLPAVRREVTPLMLFLAWLKVSKLHSVVCLIMNLTVSVAYDGKIVANAILGAIILIGGFYLPIGVTNMLWKDIEPRHLKTQKGWRKPPTLLELARQLPRGRAGMSWIWSAPVFISGLNSVLATIGMLPVVLTDMTRIIRLTVFSMLCNATCGSFLILAILTVGKGAWHLLADEQARAE